MTHPTHVPISQLGEVVTRIQQLEQENADLRFQLASNEKVMQAMREQEAAIRSPIAALLNDPSAVHTCWHDPEQTLWNFIGREHLRAAIKAQADRWREEATDIDRLSGASGWSAPHILRNCADELEGNVSPRRD